MIAAGFAALLLSVLTPVPVVLLSPGTPTFFTLKPCRGG
jgi:hypothetical protein